METAFESAVNGLTAASIFFTARTLKGRQPYQRVTRMSDQAIEFLQEWISDNVHPPRTAEDIEVKATTLVKECEADAAEAAVPLEDIVEEVGDLEELIVSRLEDLADVEPKPAG